MSVKRIRSTAKFLKRYRNFIIICLILTAALFAGEYFFLKSYQKNFEKEQAEKVPPEWQTTQQVFEEYVSALDADDWADFWKLSHPDSLDDSGDVARCMQEIFLSGGIEYARAADDTEAGPAYVIQNGEKTLAEFRMEKNADKWSVLAPEFRFEGEYSAEIVLPAGCSVYCNGTLLEDSFRDEGKENFYIKQLQDDIQDEILWYTWKVEGQLTEPELTYEAPEGKEFYTDNQGLLTICLPEGQKNELYKQADLFFDAFHRYIMYGYFADMTYAAKAASYTRKDSQAYQSIYDAYQAVKHAPCYGEYTNDLTISPIICWGENALSIDIKYHTDARHFAEVTPFDGVYKLFFLDYGKGYELCGLLMQ